MATLLTAMPALGSIMEKLPAAGREQLVALHNGFYLWLGLVGFEHHHPTIKQLVRVEGIEPAQAVQVALQSMRELLGTKAKRLPRQVTLVSSSCVPALLTLPVEADKPRKAHEMSALIQWEMESLIADASDMLVIGAILEGRSCITREQRHEVAVELEIRRSSGLLTRFGETAIELGYIDNNALQECLQLQSKVQLDNSDLRCAWQPQRLTDEDNKAQTLWACCAMNTQQRRHWQKAFSQHKLQLTGVMPLYGACATLLAYREPKCISLAIELHQELLVCYRIQNGQMGSLQSLPRLSGQSLYEQCRNLLQEYLKEDVSVIYLIADALSQPDLQGDELAQQLKDRLQYPTHWVGSTQIGQQSLTGLLQYALLGSAALRARSTNNKIVALLAAQDPTPPLWKNPLVYRFGVPTMMLIALAGHALYSNWHLEQLENQLIDMELEMAKQSQINKQLGAMNSASSKSQQQLTQLQAELENIRVQSNQLEQRVISRGRLAPRLLKAIVSSVGNNVMLDSITEPSNTSSRNYFNIKAWAVDNPSATGFTQYLESNLKRINYEVADPDIRQGVGRFGLQGYTVDLWVVPVKDKDKDAN